MASLNLVARVLRRQLSDGPPGSQISRHRRLYENIVPNDQANQVEPPDCHICKFLPSGNLVCFGYMQQELVVYSYKGPSSSLHSQEGTLQYEDGLAFSQFFKLKFRVRVSEGAENLCRDLCLAARQEKFLVIASCSAPAPPPTHAGTRFLDSLPMVGSTTFHVVNAESGQTMGKYVIKDDFIHLSHANGVYLLDDRLCILAIRSQTIHILHITEEGQLLVAHKLGEHCQDDDELELMKYEAAEAAWLSKQSQDTMDELQKRLASHDEAGSANSQPMQPQLGAERLQPPGMSSRGRATSQMQRAASAPLPLDPPWQHVLESAARQRRQRDVAADGAPSQAAQQSQSQARTSSGSGLITGIRQRVMAYLYLRGLQQKGDENQRSLMMYFEDFAGLVMWKVQMLDSKNLLISMGPPDASLHREMGSASSHSFCLLVWSLPQARVVDLHHVGSRALLHLYQTHWHMFHRGCMVSPWHHFLSPPGGCRAVRRVLTNLPASSQLLSPSPYLDLTLFHYDEKHMSAMVRPRVYQEQPLKFFARARADRPRFKIQAAATEAPARLGRIFVAHHFHPYLPVVLCVVQGYTDQTQLTIFLRSQ